MLTAFHPTPCRRNECLNCGRSGTLFGQGYAVIVTADADYLPRTPNGKLIHNSIINGPYVRRMILEPADYTQLYDFLKYNQKEVDELKVKRLAKIQDPLALIENSNNPYAFPAPHQDQPSFNQNYMQQPMPNSEDITDPTTAINMALVLMAKAFKLNYSTPTSNNQRISSNPRNRQIAQPSMNMGQDRQMHMVGADLDEIEEVHANCILMANLQQASSSGTQTDKASVYDSDRSAEVHDYENCDDNEIFNMFTQEEQYTELLKHIPEPHQVPQNDNNVISKVTSVKNSEETVEQHPINFEKTRALYDSLYQNLAIEVEKVNSKLKNENVELEFQVLNYARENAHVKATYKNMFDFIYVSRTQTKTIIASLQKQLHNSIYENAKLRAQLFNKVSDQKENKRGTSANTKFAKQSIVKNLPK
nr:hypothetical protein [Tanacetum cinerariifolium]